MNNKLLSKIITVLGENATLISSLATLFGLLYTIYHNSRERSDTKFQEAVYNLSDDSPVVRSVSIEFLAPYLSSFYFPWNRENIRRRFIVAKTLANHLIYEKDAYLTSLCANILTKANWQVKDIIIRSQYLNNLSLWEERCEFMAAIKASSETIKNEIEQHKLEKQSAKLLFKSLNEKKDLLRQYDEKLSIVQKLLANLLKRKKLVPRFRELNLRGIHFEFCDLIGVDLSKCDLTEATITHTNLKNSNLKNAKLERAIFLHCYFSNTNLSNTVFKGAILCRNHFDNLQNYNSLNQSRLRIWNKGEVSDIEEDDYCNDGEDEKWKEDDYCSDNEVKIWMEKEFDWTGVWITVPSCRNSTLSSQWTSINSTDTVVTAKIEKNLDDLDSGRCFSSLSRVESSDRNNGKYAINSISKLEEFNPSKPASLEYVTGSRSILSCEQSWEAVRWIIEKPVSVKCDD